ncbi:MAG: pirin family protein [Phenylobacterium sp.]|uniref:pirin family protein n=1 Tax=Phenylobacterium sp. TaxID=1871053 RepID=UPI00273474EE|nr:pirin family protein [Phenylobacterium sp.]MDP3173971.1 pirin family protein [Phenylobacterium sp.]
MSSRSVVALHASPRDDIGDLVTRRPLPGAGLDQLDPFLFLNHHGPQTYPPGNAGLPFGPHPHRGFETVTLIVEGELAHHDSGGHESVIRAGGVQWMTAGRGVVHAELSPAAFKAKGGPLEILQLWVNLPARLKLTTPRYIGLQRAAIPVVQLDEGRSRLHLISGALEGRQGPISSLTGVFMSTVDLKAGARTWLPAPSGRTVFLYVVRGTVSVAGTPVAAHHLVELGDGDSVEVAAEAPALLMFAHADPIGEPVISYGPFVMNTEEEIREAIADYQAGRFGDLPG